MDTVYGSDIMSQPGKTVFCDQTSILQKRWKNYPYDLKKAKELAKEKWPGSGNPSASYLQQSASWYAGESAIVIQQQLKAAGINVELQAMDSPSFFSMCSSSGQAVMHRPNGSGNQWLGFLTG